MNISDLINLFQSEASQFPLILYVVTFFLSLSLGFFISWCYRSFSYTVFYSKTFNFTLCYLPFVISLIILSVKSDLAISLGILGALSIVRYRTPIKEPLDLFFILWSVAEGVAIGAGLFFLSILSSLILGVLLKLAGYSFLSSFWQPKSYIVIFRFPEGEDSLLENIKQKLFPYVKSLKEKHLVKEKDLLEIGFEIVPKKQTDIIKLLKRIPSQKTLVVSPEGNLISY